MAEGFVDTATVGKMALGFAQTAQTVMTFLIVFAFIGIMIWLIFRNLQFKHTVVIRTLVSNRVIIKVKKAKEIIDKKGVMWWKLRGVKEQEKRLMPVPDPRCIDINEKGRRWVEVYELPTGGYVTIYDKANIGLIPDDIDSISTSSEQQAKQNITETEPDGLERDEKLYQWKQLVINRWIKENDYDKAFKPFGTLERQAIVNNIKDAHERKHKGFMEQLPQMIAMGSMVMIVICMLIFAPDWFEGKQAVAGEYKQLASIQQENLLILRDVKLGIQTIATKQTEFEGKIANIVPNAPD